MYLKVVMDYYDQVEMQKEYKHDQAQRLPRVTASAAFENPAHLIDTANYVQCA